jgi:hypothetical protein
MWGKYSTYRRLIFRLMQIVGLMLILALSVVGIAIMCVQPWSVLTCRYVETKQVSCQLQERIAWVIPVWETPIPHLKEAYVKQETQIREDEDGREYTVSVYRAVLISASGEIVLKGTDEIGASADLTTTRINDYLNTPTDKSLTVWGFGLWGHTLATLIGGLWFILFALLFVAAIVDMVVGMDTVTGLYQKVKRKRAWSVVWIKDIVDTVIGLYQKVKRKRSVIFGSFLGALLGGYLLGFGLEGMCVGSVIGLCASLAVGQTKDNQGLAMRNILIAVIGFVFILVIARTTTVTCTRDEPSLPFTCEFTVSRLLWTTGGEFEPHNGWFRDFPYLIRRAMVRAVGGSASSVGYQADARVLNYIVGGILILTSLYLAIREKTQTMVAKQKAKMRE